MWTAEHYRAYYINEMKIIISIYFNVTLDIIGVINTYDNEYLPEQSH